MAVQNRLAHAEEEKEDTGLLFSLFRFPFHFYFALLAFICYFVQKKVNQSYYDVIFFCIRHLSPCCIYANTHWSRVLAQGPLVFSPTR